MTIARPLQSTVAIFEQPGRPFTLRQLDVPILQPGEILVQVECCTVCGSDFHTIAGRRHESLPVVLGHEVVGRVVEFAAESLHDIQSQLLQVNDRITWSNCVSCGRCKRCTSGLPQKCIHLFKYGHNRFDESQPLSGGLAEFMILRANTSLIKLPIDRSAELLCPANCATATVVNAVRSIGELIDKRVLILGAGMLGLTAAAYARDLSAARIALFDLDANRLEKANRLGLADQTISDREDLLRHVETESNKFDAVFEMTGNADVVQSCFETVAIGGQIALVGSVLPTSSVSINPEFIVRRCITVAGIHNYTPQDLQRAVEFLSRTRHAAALTTLVEQTVALTEIDSAIELARREHPIRIAVIPSGL